MDEHEQAILDWVNTFELPKQCESLAELSDGIVLSTVLHEICPEHFQLGALTKSNTGNWALAAGNLRKLLKMLDDYFRDVLRKRVDMESVDVTAIAKTHDPDELLNFLELVVGAAVMCEHKAQFIRKIFELDHHSQAVLKGLVETVMARAEDLDARDSANDDAYTNDDNNDSGMRELSFDVDGRASMDHSSILEAALASNAGSEEDLVRANEMILYLKNERQRLTGDLRGLEHSNDALRRELTTLKESSAVSRRELLHLEGNEKDRHDAVENLNQKLQAELSDCKREVDLKGVELDVLRNELKHCTAKFEASREIQAKFEMETHQQADELDLLRDKAARLTKAEQSLEKFQKRLEEMNSLKKLNKELSDKMDQYLDQLAEQEAQLKGLATMNKMVEQYKNKAVELEREKFEAISAAQTKEIEVTRLSQDLEARIQQQNFLEDELQGVRAQLAGFTDLDSAVGAGDGVGMDGFEVESVPTLREKVRKLEREVRVLTESAAGSGAQAVEAQELQLLRAELVDVRNMKKEREDALLALKKQMSELQLELGKRDRAMSEADRTSASTASLRESAQKLAETANTVRLLESKLKEKETSINKLEQEKSKLELYAKRSLNTFKEKYMQVLQTMKDEKQDLERRLQAQTDKAVKSQDLWHREEKLLASAMFEIGVRMMDRKINAQLADPYAQQNTNIGIQRMEQGKTSTDPAQYAAAANTGDSTSKKLFSELR